MLINLMVVIISQSTVCQILMYNLNKYDCITQLYINKDEKLKCGIEL